MNFSVLKSKQKHLRYFFGVVSNWQKKPHFALAWYCFYFWSMSLQVLKSIYLPKVSEYLLENILHKIEMILLPWISDSAEVYLYPFKHLWQNLLRIQLTVFSCFCKGLARNFWTNPKYASFSSILFAAILKQRK